MKLQLSNAPCSWARSSVQICRSHGWKGNSYNQRTAPAAAAPEQEGLYAFKSPMVGTFYRAPSPEAVPFASVGDTVDPDQGRLDLCGIDVHAARDDHVAFANGVRRDP